MASDAPGSPQRALVFLGKHEVATVLEDRCKGVTVDLHPKSHQPAISELPIQAGLKSGSR